MQYNTFELDKDSQDLCKIITPFGKHKYARLLMGLKYSPNIAQAIMESTLAGIKDADFQLFLEMFSIKDVCLTSKNPQSNAI
jgi:hypothetical protein